MSLLQAIQPISSLSKKVLSTIIFFKDLIMLKPLYEFLPNANVIKGPHAHDSPIIVQANNMSFSNFIPKQFLNSGIEDFINYVKSCHLRYAFCNFPVLFYPKQVCEFYYSCSIDFDTQTITETNGYGQSRVTIDA